VGRVDKLLDLIDRSILNKEERYFIQKVCAKSANVFHLPCDLLSATNICKQKVRLKQYGVPVYVKRYRLSHAHKKINH